MFSAKIYNRNILIEKYECNSSSDDELLFLLVKKYGWDILSEINGDFSGSLEIDGELVLYRDHIGVNSIYYYLKGDVFEYSDSIEGLLSIKGVDASLNDEYLYKVFTRRNILSNETTHFKFIKCVPPGCWMRVLRTDAEVKTEIHQYWKLCEKKIWFKTEDEYCKRLRELITDAVKIRFEYAGDNVGVELSGGLDSSIITILLSRLGANVSCVSWSAPFDEIKCVEGDERSVIEDICVQEGITCHYLSRKDELDKEYYSKLPPYANTLTISKTSNYLSKEGIKYIFSGHGGDEGVSRRCSLYELWYKREYKSFFRCFYEKNKGKNLRLLRTFRSAIRYLNVVKRQISTEWQNRELSSEEYLRREFIEDINVTCEPLYFNYNAVKYINQGGLRPRLENLYYQAHKFNAEYLLPYLDYRVLEFATSIPRNLFLNHKADRYIFRKTFEDMMPDSLKKVNYKDIPSVRNGNDITKTGKKVKHWLNPLVDVLDRAFWSKYWDFESIKNFGEKEYDELSKEERTKVYMLCDYLIECKLLQNYCELNKND